jgi:hypothetical protein
MTLFAITNYHRPICWMICFIQFVSHSVISILALTTGNPVYLIATKGTRRVWPVSRGCLLLLGTWSHLRNCRRSVLPFTRFWIMITFYTLLTSVFCTLKKLWEIQEIDVSPGVTFYSLYFCNRNVFVCMYLVQKGHYMYSVYKSNLFLCIYCSGVAYVSDLWIGWFSFLMVYLHWNENLAKNK